MIFITIIVTMIMKMIVIIIKQIFTSREDIIMVGWIHTHPAYDVFLSSVDMHNQYEYQKMLKEFIAIVCSIK